MRPRSLQTRSTGTGGFVSSGWGEAPVGELQFGWGGCFEAKETQPMTLAFDSATILSGGDVKEGAAGMSFTRSTYGSIMIHR